jgi:hypothetical protein
MQSEPSPSIVPPICLRTLRLKVQPESYPWHNAAAIEVNQVWNYANEVSARAARPFVEYFEHIGSDTIQRFASIPLADWVAPSWRGSRIRPP